jgi:Lon protease-like protein
MPDRLEEIPAISDVGYLLTILRIAKKDDDTEIIQAVITRFKELGLLTGSAAGEDDPFRNLRSGITDILGTADHLPQSQEIGSELVAGSEQPH